MTEPEKKTRAKRRAPISARGRSILQKERQRMMTEQAELGQQLADEARLHRALRVNTVRPEHIAISRGVVRRVAGALAAEGVSVPMVVKRTHSDIDAWPEFEQILARYPVNEDPRMQAAVLRGILYHEGGHISWTMPLADLLQMAANEGYRTSFGLHDAAYRTAWNILEDQRMEMAVVTD